MTRRIAPTGIGAVPDLPHGFELGVATSAYQIEGAWNEDGRGASIWDTFSQTPGRVFDDVPGDRGAEHYHRMPEDIRLLQDLGVDSYRFSLSWSRILPDGKGPINQAGVDFYFRLLDRLHEAGITPVATLYHWDLPQALEDLGGWRNRDVQHWFADYATLAFARFGSSVSRWATLNEPIANWVGYGLGIFAPGITDPAGGRNAMHNALLAHGQAVRAFRASDATGDIGVVVDVWKRSTTDPTPENLRLVREGDADSFESFLNPLFRGGYSPFQLERWGAEGVLPDNRDGDQALIEAPLDFFGLNIYNRVMVDGAPTRPAGSDGFVGGNFLDDGQYYDPTVAYDVLLMLRDEYDIAVPIYITENGVSNCNEDVIDGRIHDHDRIDYLRGFLTSIARAAAEGVDVRGYALWSLVDNYEWSAGYSSRFGLYHLDLETFDRIPKDSALWYRDVIRARSLLEDITRARP